MKCLIENLEVNYPCSPVCSLYGDCMAAFLKARKQQVRTNANRIRAMSDKELAIALVKYEGTEKRVNQYGGHEHIFHGPNGEKCGTKAYAIELWEKWLKQPAEETDDGLL